MTNDTQKCTESARFLSQQSLASSNQAFEKVLLLKVKYLKTL